MPKKPKWTQKAKPNPGTRKKINERIYGYKNALVRNQKEYDKGNINIFTYRLNKKTLNDDIKELKHRLRGRYPIRDNDRVSNKKQSLASEHSDNNEILDSLISLTNTSYETPEVQTQIDSLTSELVSSTYYSPETETETDVGTQISQHRAILGDELSNMDNHPMFGQLYTIIDQLYGYTSCFANRVLDAAAYSTKQIAKLLYVIWGKGYIGKITVIYICSKLNQCDSLHTGFHTLVPIRGLIDAMGSITFIRYILDTIQKDVYKTATDAAYEFAPILGEGLFNLLKILGLEVSLGAWFKGILTEILNGPLSAAVNAAAAAATAAATAATGAAAAATGAAAALEMAPDAIAYQLANNQVFRDTFLQQPVAASLTTSFVNGMFGAIGQVFVPIAASAIGAAANQQTLVILGGKSTRKLKRKNQTKRRAL